MKLYCERADLSRFARQSSSFPPAHSIVQVLGPGCSKCEKLKHNVEEAITQSGVEATVEKITDINVMMGFGVMMTPALAIDGEVKAVGKVLSTEEIKKLLT